MLDSLKNKYRMFFKEGHFKPCHILFIAAGDVKEEDEQGALTYMSIAKLENINYGKNVYKKYREDIINRTEGLYEFITAMEAVMDELSWNHGDVLRRKYAKGETVRTEIAKRALENFIKEIETSDLYDFNKEGERQLDRIASIAQRSEEADACKRAIKVAAKFRNLRPYDYMEPFFEFREKFKTMQTVQTKNLDVKVKDYDEKYGVFAKEPVNYGNETRKYHLMEGNKRLRTRDKPEFIIPKEGVNPQKLYICESVIAECATFGEIIAHVEEDYDGITLFQAMPSNEKCIYYALLEDGVPVKTSKEPVFYRKKKRGANYKIRACLDESDMSVALMLSKDFHVGQKSKLEKYMESGGGSEMYFITHVMEAFRQTDSKLYEKMMAFHRSKNDELIVKTFKTLSFLLTTQKASVALDPT